MASVIIITNRKIRYTINSILVVIKTVQLFPVTAVHLLFIPDCFQDPIIHMAGEGTFHRNGLHQYQNYITSFPQHMVEDLSTPSRLQPYECLSRTEIEADCPFSSTISYIQANINNAGLRCITSRQDLGSPQYKFNNKCSTDQF